MPRVEHIQAAPLLLRPERKEEDVLCLWQDSDKIQNISKRDTRAFGNEGPTLFASLMGDMRARRITLQVVEREGGRTSNQALHLEPPVGESSSQQTLVRFVLGR